MQKENYKNWVLDNNLLSQLTEKSLDSLISQASLVHFSKDETILIQEDKAQRFYLITKGWVKLYRETIEGDQAVIDILSPKNLFGESSLFHDGKYNFSASATENIELISLPLNILSEEIKTNPQLSMALLNTMAKHQEKQERELEHMTLQKAPQRIGCFILRLLSQSKDNNKNNVQFPYDKTLVASKLGMQPETFSRALNKLKDATNIKVKGSNIEIADIEKLSSYSCCACSSEFPCKDLKKPNKCGDIK